MATYDLTDRAELIKINHNEEYLDYEISSINHATEYLYRGLHDIINTYDGLPLDTRTVNNLIAGVRKVFVYSCIAHFLKRDVFVSIMFEVGGGIRISTDISDD